MASSLRTLIRPPRGTERRERRSLPHRTTRTSVHGLFEAQADRTPDAVAVVAGDAHAQAHLTYGELDRRANQLARHLRRRGVAQESFVAVCLERSLEMAVGVLGVLKAGAAYVPLDPAYPAERIAFMARDTNAALLLTQAKFAALFPRGLAQLALDADWAAVATEGEGRLSGLALPEQIAYAIYTSGSTGTPKGVLVTHEGVVNHNLAVADLFGLGPSDRVAQCTSLAFDIAVEEMFPTWARGGAVVLHPPGVVGAGDDFWRWVEAAHISVLDLPTALWHEGVAHLERRSASPPTCLRLVVVGGQKASSQVLAKWDALTDRRVAWINGYGPTETTVATIFFTPPLGTDWNADRDIPIGQPIPGTAAHILDPAGQPCADGVAGELFIGGLGVARGYLNRPDLTAERFLPNPFGGPLGDRMYRTGDVVRRNVDGDIEFLGRTDDQVKVRGFRIELGEIEAALRRHPLVHDAFVIAREEASGHDRRLVGYVVSNGQPVAVDQLRAFVRLSLPDYMVPGELAVLPAFPLTPTGKIDRARLPAIAPTRGAATARFLAPRTATEESLACIWSEVLGMPTVGVEDNFFELGGHSLRATQVAARVCDAFDVEMPLSFVFTHPTIAALAPVVDGLCAARPTSVVRGIPAAPRDGRLPLASCQERVWFLQRLDPTSLAYNFQTLLLFTGQLDVRALRASLDALVRRHEILRTSFPEVDGTPVQVVHAPYAIDLPVIDLSGLPAGERACQAAATIAAEIAAPFDVAALPLIRWSLLRLEADEYQLIHIEHHLVHDGWSFNVFRRELLELYVAFAGGAEQSPLSPLPIQFADYAAWERRRIAQGEIEPQIAYWKAQLADSVVTELPIARPRPAAQTFRGALHAVDQPDDLYASLRALSKAEGVTLFMTLVAAFFVLLHRYSGDRDMAVGTGVANRQRRETEGLLGMLVNNVVLRARFEGNPRFRDFLADVRATTLGAYANQAAPFDHVVKALGRRSDPSRNPLFQIMFSFHDSPLDEPSLPGVQFKCVEAVGNRSAKFDLNVVVVPHAEQRAKRTAPSAAGGMTLLWEYNTDLFEQDAIERLAAHYGRLLHAVVADADTRVSDVDMLGADQRRQVLVEWNRTASPYPSDATIGQLFERQVEATPDAVAVVCGAEQLTYRELNDRANRLARALVGHGVGPGSLVAVSLARTASMFASLVAILKAGGAYVPLDRAYPDERLKLMVADTRAQLLVTDAAQAGRYEGWCARVLAVDTILSTNAAQEPAGNVAIPAGADDLAYVMYTSGSTGVPKGVAVPHRGVVRLVWGLPDVTLDATTRILHLAPGSFDASTFEVWGALLRGGTCVACPESLPTARLLGDVLRDHQVNTLWLTASLFNAVVDEMPEALAPVAQLLVGGDALSLPHVLRAQRALPGTRIINGYGPTESTTFACCYPLPAPLDAALPSVPIGRPIGHTQAYVLDARLRPVPPGVAGELCIGGDGLARGYLHQPALTAERFVPNPFGAAGSRLYRTGDLARHRADGTIEFLGRRDAQVKVRGYRIELGEIEAVLRRQAGIRDAAVVVHEPAPGDKRLVAYVVGERGRAVPPDAVRDGLGAALPGYMVPAVIRVLDALPLSPTGKLDRQALPAPHGDDVDVAAPASESTTEVEQALAAIWRDVLAAPRVSVHDNFFDAGGHSLLALGLMARIRQELGVDLPLRELFTHPTIAELAARIVAEGSKDIAARRTGSAWKHLVELRPGADGHAVYFMPGGFGGDYEFLVYARLVHFVGGAYRFYGLRAHSADGAVAAPRRVEDIAADYLREIRQLQPEGPYLLVGNCVGGVVALEAARQLERAGQAVGVLVLMDTDYPRRARYLRDVWDAFADTVAKRWKLAYYRGRVAHHHRALRELGWPARLRYAIRRTSTLAQTPAPGPGVDPRDAVRRTYVEALRRYRPRRYPGAVKLIVSEDASAALVAAWAKVATGSVDVFPVKGDHEAYIRDHVKEAAAQLKKCLDASVPVTEA